MDSDRPDQFSPELKYQNPLASLEWKMPDPPTFRAASTSATTVLEGISTAGHLRST